LTVYLDFGVDTLILVNSRERVIFVSVLLGGELFMLVPLATRCCLDASLDRTAGLI
jgi:hypothetical protein